VRKNYPLGPTYGITSNSSQAQTFRKVGVDEKVGWFAHGQGYTSKSRCDPENTFLVLTEGQARFSNPVNSLVFDDDFYLRFWN
jgi:hypothetical protein